MGRGGCIFETKVFQPNPMVVFMVGDKGPKIKCDVLSQQGQRPSLEVVELHPRGGLHRVVDAFPGRSR